MKVYEIRDAMLDTLDIFLESAQDNTDKENYNDVMEYLKTELQNKSSNIIKYIRNMENHVLVLKTEVERLELIKKSKETKVKNLKNYLKNVLLILEKKKIDTDIGSYGLRKTSKVEITNIEKIPKVYLKEKYEVLVDKLSISTKLKAGEIVEGTMLLEDYSLQVR